jgi:predicted  nucleic acid-binding Zn-ribbon protein/GTP-binding protein EngB required for normal cell division
VNLADFHIKKLVVEGVNKKDAVAEFDRELTIISGPSNTGKTTILRCIDYIFGSDNLPFASTTGYDTIMLFVGTENGSIQFTRKLESNNIDVVSSDDRIESGTYKARSATKTMESISKVWLALIGIEDDHDIIANENFRPQHLTWRTILPIILIKERQIERESSILMPEGGAKSIQGRTAFLSSLLFLIYGNDFSDFDERESKKERAIRKAAVEKYINKELSGVADRKQCILDMIGAFDGLDVQKEIDSAVQALSDIEEKISAAMSNSQSLLNSMIAKKERLTECQMLISRYAALKTQYSADIKRLSFIVDGETVMKHVSHDSTCPFCNGKIPTQNTKSYIEAARSELSRIVAQYNDLVGAEKDIEQQIQELQTEITLLTEQKSSAEELIAKDLKPQARALSETIDAYRVYIQLNYELDVIHRLADGWYSDLRDMQNEDVSEIKYKPMDKFDDRFWEGMDAALIEILTECKYTPLISARFSKSSFDLEINGQAKALTQGKGYCSILNTIVIMAFRKFMLKNAVYNPGLCIVDTPLHGIDEGTRNETSESIQTALFQYFINSREMGQLIIVENERTLPNLDYDKSGIKQIVFTGVVGEEQCGFLHDCKFDLPLSPNE